MSDGFHIVVCGSIVPDPLQTLQPNMGPQGPGIKNELMLPSVLDPWAAHALYEAAHLAKNVAGSKIWWVTLGPKAKLQQLMMSVGQKLAFELVAIDGPAGGFTDSFATAQHLAEAIDSIPGLDRSRLLLFGGWESASRAAGTTMQMVGERLGITEQFQAVDELILEDDSRFRILERVEGGKHQIAICDAPPMAIGWATGHLPEPPNNPQIGMLNMRTVMPALQRAKPVRLSEPDLSFRRLEQPEQRRNTRVVRDWTADQIAEEIVAWVKGGGV